MDVFKKLGVPVEEIEWGIKVILQTAIIFVGIFGNIYNIYSVLSKSKLPKSTNVFITSLSVALIFQTCNAIIDYVDHLYNKGPEEEYFWGLRECDTWHTLNVYLPMLLALLCFCSLLDRLIVLTQPELHSRVMNICTVTIMLGVSYILPALVTVPPIYFKWYTTEEHIRWRNDKECKFKTNMTYALVSPVITFWAPLALIAIVITRMFKTMERQERAVLLSTLSVSSGEKLPCVDIKKTCRVPWKVGEMRRHHRLAITLWSVYWNVALFWIPQHAWQFIYKVTDADWPRATNFMAWVGYLPSLILPALYRYYNIYNL
ncbi:octopamine receptor activity protein [Homalodisca vitripennis]|nr:octopamine receptor activity protein [Homalodisca vitripennis]